jgi:hypothetical protein
MMSTNCPIFVSVETPAYSGATLLAFLLGTHPRIATVGEMDGLIPREDPDEYLCSCGQRIKVCQFWQSVKIAMHTKGFEFDVAHFDTKFIVGGRRLILYLRTGSSRNHVLDSIRDAIFHAWPGEIRHLKALVARNVAFVEAVLEVTGKDVFVDTSKNRLRLQSLRKFSPLDVRAIHLVRDVRGVVASRLQRGEDIGAREAARQWVKSNQKLQTNLRSLPEEARVLLRYEDLCQDVPGTLERLFHFCGVDPGVKVTDFRAVPHHIVGNPMRLRAVSGIRLDERWKSLLTEDQLKEIEQAAGTLSRRYGYCW